MLLPARSVLRLKGVRRSRSSGEKDASLPVALVDIREFDKRAFADQITELHRLRINRKIDIFAEKRFLFPRSRTKRSTSYDKGSLVDYPIGRLIRIKRFFNFDCHAAISQIRAV